MSRLKTESKPISQSERNLWLIVLLLIACGAVQAQQSPPIGVKFEVVSVRVLSNKEAADRSPDFIGPNIAVRLRLSVSERGLSFYGWKNSAVPAGYRVQQGDQGTSWLYGRGGTEKKSTSPGLQAVLFGSTGEWITLPAHSAIEWEQLDATSFAGEKHAFTAFVKQRNVDQPTEIVSDSFSVPFGATSTTR
jgi:hypothetical protein